MFCPNCGKEIKDKIEFCNECGFKLNKNIFKKIFSFWKILLILFIVTSAIVFSIIYFSNSEDDSYSMLLELNPDIEPLGVFDTPNLFYSELLNDEEWFSHIQYYDNEEGNSLFSNSDNQFPNQRSILSSVVKIVCEDEDYFYYGSGTNFSNKGIIITNFHVVSDVDVDSCVVGFPDPGSGLIKEAYWATVLIDKEDETGLDLAYLIIEDPVFDEDYNIYGDYRRIAERTFPYFESTEECFYKETQIGDDLFIIGYPLLAGGNLTMTNGLVSSIYSSDGYLITSAKIISGNSGGAAIGKDGCFIGVPMAIYYEDEEEYLGEIIDAEFVDLFNESMIDDLEDYYDAL